MTDKQLIKQLQKQCQALSEKLAELEDAFTGASLIIDLERATNKQAENYIKQLETILDSYEIKYVKPKRLGQHNDR